MSNPPNLNERVDLFMPTMQRKREFPNRANQNLWVKVTLLEEREVLWIQSAFFIE